MFLKRVPHTSFFCERLGMLNMRLASLNHGAFSAATFIDEILNRRLASK